MIQIDNKTKCCGCTACFSVCALGAITMQPDDEGFLYPVIDSTKCTNCKMCEKVCFELSGYKKKYAKKAYAIQHNDSSVLEDSTSGGAFSALCQSELEKGAVICGAAFSEDFTVRHIMISKNHGDLSVFRGSKYVQSNILGIYSEIRNYLNNNKRVVFSGTSCQIAGLTNFLSKEYENLITVEVICHGTPSPLLWDKYLKYLKEKYNSQIANIKFRAKTYGYHSGTMRVEFTNKKIYTGSARVDYMLKSFFKEISSRPSCYECPIKGKERPADISIFDCWHAQELTGLPDNDKGFTNVLINSEKGEMMLEAAKDLIRIQEVDIESAIHLDGVMITEYPKKHNKRHLYYQFLNEYGLENTIDKLIPVSKVDLIIEKCKMTIYSLGLMELARRIKNRKKGN